MGKKASAPKPPDYGPLIEAQERAANRAFDLAEEQFAWAKETYAENKDLVRATGDAFLEAMEFHNANARRDRERYEEYYQPLENQLIEDYETYSSDQFKAQERGRAIATVDQQFEAARQNAQQDLESYGINPTDTRYGALDLGIRTAAAAQKAAAANESDRRVDETARALRAEAINIGRGYPAQALGSSAAGQSAGGAANAGALNLTNSGAQTMGTAPQYLSSGNAGLAQVGNLMNTSYQNQLDAFNANQQSSSGIGGILGGVLGAVVPFFEEGGPVPEEASPSGGAIPDDVDARVSAGEFVIPEETVRWHGEKAMHALIEKAQKERAETEQQTGAIPTNRYAGPVALPPG